MDVETLCLEFGKKCSIFGDKLATEEQKVEPAPDAGPGLLVPVRVPTNHLVPVQPEGNFYKQRVCKKY